RGVRGGPRGGSGAPAVGLPQGGAGVRPAPVQGTERGRALLVEGQAVPPCGHPLREESAELPGLRAGSGHDGDVAVARTSQVAHLVSTEPRGPLQLSGIAPLPREAGGRGTSCEVSRRGEHTPVVGTWQNGGVPRLSACAALPCASGPFCHGGSEMWQNAPRT